MPIFRRLRSLQTRTASRAETPAINPNKPRCLTSTSVLPTVPLHRLYYTECQHLLLLSASLLIHCMTAYVTARSLCYSHMWNLTCITARNYFIIGADCCTRVWTNRVLLWFLLFTFIILYHCNHGPRACC